MGSIFRKNLAPLHPFRTIGCLRKKAAHACVCYQPIKRFDMIEKHERTITISDSPQYLAKDGEYAPQIRITGKWLKDAGFKKGAKVKIEIVRNKLVLVPIKQKTPSNKR